MPLSLVLGLFYRWFEVLADTSSDTYSGFDTYCFALVNLHFKIIHNGYKPVHAAGCG